MKPSRPLLACFTLSALLAACGGSEEAAPPAAPPAEPAPTPTEDDHADDHAHAEDSLGSVTLGGHEIELAQGHGAIAAGKEGHLVVKLPWNDHGSSIVRAWIGSEDRTASYVGKGQYAPSHDDYDVHATAPDPLPEGARWWIEVEKPDGTKLSGSAQPIVE